MRVERAVHVRPGGVGARLAAEGAPERVDAADQIDAAVVGIVLEEVDQFPALIRASRGGP